ncbi:unnamed protein product [Closterium sp. NIES-65]|nr:unnamed protein product [Closterium sp. NIES-65]
MDGNREAGERCVEVARAALAAGDKERALRFLHKAQRLYPSPEVASLLAQVASSQAEKAGQAEGRGGAAAGAGAARNAEGAGEGGRREGAGAGPSSRAGGEEGGADGSGTRQRSRGQGSREAEVGAVDERRWEARGGEAGGQIEENSQKSPCLSCSLLRNPAFIRHASYPPPLFSPARPSSSRPDSSAPCTYERACPRTQQGEGAPATAEQAQLVARILRTSCYYEVLDLPQTLPPSSPPPPPPLPHSFPPPPSSPSLSPLPPLLPRPPSSPPRSPPPHPPCSQQSEGAPATAEQAQLVARILRTSCYYEVLELPKGAAEDDVKKAYRKLSLKVHPDKNKAKGAEEAFKVVSRAFKCLTDADLRANYDRYGHEDPQHLLRQRQQRQRQQYAGGFGGGPRMYTSFFDDDDFDPNDIFNAFFGVHPAHAQAFRAHMHQQRMHQRHQQQHRRQQQQEGQQGGATVNPIFLMQLLPIILFLAYNLLPSPEALYRLRRDDVYSEQHVTRVLSVPYFVKTEPDFATTYPAGSKDRIKIENSVEADHRERVETMCHNERVQQAHFYKWGQVQRARAMHMPNCEELKRIRTLVYG